MSSSPSAADIISYIGIPLAVLGVLPIIYTFIRSVLTLQSVRRALRHNALDAVTRGSVMSGIIEVEIPRATLTPLERDEVDYWTLNPNPSRLKGGSWTLFRWNRIVTSKKLYRLAYSDDLQLPQAEVDFEELVTFLLDRGAVPDGKGIHMLRLAGLWTPAGTSILKSPDGSESALRVSLPDDSDGVLSLALNWHPIWDKRASDSLPSSWIRLKGPEARTEEVVEEEENKKVDEKTRVEEEAAAKSVPLIEETSDEKIAQQDLKEDSGRMNDRIAKHEESSDRLPISKGEEMSHSQPSSMRIHVSVRNSALIINAIQYETAEGQRPIKHIHPQIEHLQVTPISTWIPSALVALGQQHASNLWALHISPELIALATKPSLPCGVLVEAGLVIEADTPTWATTYDPHEEHRHSSEAFFRQQARAAAERTLPPAQASAAKALREAEERNAFHNSARDRLVRDRQRRELREREALGSPVWGVGVVVERAASWLQKMGTSEWRDMTEWMDAAERLLWAIVMDAKRGTKICTVLERWREWNERGGMNGEDFSTIQQDVSTFCQAILLMGLLRLAADTEESALALDVHELMRVWKKVRVG